MKENELLILIEKIADIQASIAINTFCQLSMLEALGADGDTMMRSIDELQAKFAEATEADIRKRLGLVPRPEPRQPVLSWNGNGEWPSMIEWNKRPVN